jgi:hypothetical protein
MLKGVTKLPCIAASSFMSPNYLNELLTQKKNSLFGWAKISVHTQKLNNKKNTIEFYKLNSKHIFFISLFISQHNKNTEKKSLIMIFIIKIINVLYFFIFFFSLFDERGKRRILNVFLLLKMYFKKNAGKKLLF